MGRKLNPINCFWIIIRKSKTILLKWNFLCNIICLIKIIITLEEFFFFLIFLTTLFHQYLLIPFTFIAPVLHTRPYYVYIIHVFITVKKNLYLNVNVTELVFHNFIGTYLLEYFQSLILKDNLCLLDWVEDKKKSIWSQFETPSTVLPKIICFIWKLFIMENNFHLSLINSNIFNFFSFKWFFKNI